MFSLYGRAVDDGYITKGAADAAQKAAIEQAQETPVKKTRKKVK